MTDLKTQGNVQAECMSSTQRNFMVVYTTKKTKKKSAIKVFQTSCTLYSKSSKALWWFCYIEVVVHW